MELENLKRAQELITEKNALEAVSMVIKTSNNAKIKIVEPYEWVSGENVIHTIHDAKVLLPYLNERLNSINKELLTL